MTTVIYDGSFEGLLTAVFEIYEYQINDPAIYATEYAATSLFGKPHIVDTNQSKFERVYKKLQQKLTPNALSQLRNSLLSELQEIPDGIYRYIVYVLSSISAVENNFNNPDVLLIQQTSRKVHREKHRMEAFVRFQLTKDGLYYCIIQPDYDVLSLISDHFEKRYADQRWLIYDTRRKYGIYYDLQRLENVFLNFEVDTNNKNSMAAICDEKEELYQRLWQQYFSSVNIAARKNMKLHIQHMPKRYWRYLVEKKGNISSGD